ncbi:DUF448 domain-containing protein [Patescibacteria group bacterium]|nr:DUF448 domain-containing protein [Patescibacteria group bacterium]
MTPPTRTCIACGAKREKRELAHLLRNQRGIVIDMQEETQSRGAYLCKNGEQIDENYYQIAKQKGAFQKAFRAEKISLQKLQAASSAGGDPHGSR